MEDITKYVPALNTEKHDWTRGPFTPVTSDISFTLANNKFILLKPAVLSKIHYLPLDTFRICYLASKEHLHTARQTYEVFAVCCCEMACQSNIKCMKRSA
jgi:hypothetical protein